MTATQSRRKSQLSTGERLEQESRTLNLDDLEQLHGWIGQTLDYLLVKLDAANEGPQRGQSAQTSFSRADWGLDAADQRLYQLYREAREIYETKSHT